MTSSVDIQLRILQRELAALKRGMYGGARSYFDTVASMHTFTATSAGNKKITLGFDRPDFPMLFADITQTGGDFPLQSYIMQRTGRYEWTVFLQPGLNMPVTINCVCISEQLPTWSIS